MRRGCSFAAIATVLLVATAAHAEWWCTGRFLERRWVGHQQGGIAIVVDIIDEKVALEGLCPAAEARIGSGTLKAHWPSGACGSSAPATKLAMRFTQDCRARVVLTQGKRRTRWKAAHSTCGDGFVDGPAAEDCDGTDLAGATCPLPNGDADCIRCTSDCTWAPVPVGEGALRLAIDPSAEFATLELDFRPYDAWRRGDVDRNVVKQLYDVFADVFDQIVFVVDEREVLAPFYGVSYPVRSTVTGIGREPFDAAASYGSLGMLGRVVLLGSLDGLSGGPSLHEIMHAWGAFLPGLDQFGSHWGFAGVGGQLGGWSPGTLRQVGPNEYEADGPMGHDGFGVVANGGNSVPYAPLELYLMGLIEAEDVPSPIDVAVNPVVVDGFTGRFTADRIDHVSMADIVAANGRRSPGPATAPHHFRGLVVYLTPTALPASYLQQFRRDVAAFEFAGDDGSGLFNFYEATGGRATLQLGDLFNAMLR